MREIWFIALLGLLVSGLHPVAAQSSRPGPDADKVLVLTNDDRILGKPDAPITIIEYASLTCPHCRHFEEGVLPQIEKKWIDTGKAKLVMRDFPLDQRALQAEALARCVPPQSYYPLVKMLFAAQEQWVMAKDWPAALARTVRLAGIGKEKVDSCLADATLTDAVAQSRLTAASQLGVEATPTFFVNGKKFEGEPTVEAFDRLLSGLAGKS